MVVTSAAILDGNESTRNTTTAFLRVISLSIAFYDYLLTLPAEWRFYKSQRSWRLSPGCILFIAIRYSSIAVLLASNIGYFGDFFTLQSCQRYFIVPPVLKVVQCMVSQLILGIRTINISRRSTWVTWTIVISFFIFTTAEWFLNLWNRVPLHDRGRHNNCAAGNRPPVLTVWLFYLCAILYDVVTLTISTGYLISFGPNSGNMARLVKIMLTDGLVYFVALTGTNILNLILYRSTDEAVQSAGVSLGYALIWIMSQRILIHLRDAAAAHNRPITTRMVVSRHLPSAHSVSQAMRSQFETKSHDHFSSAFDIDWSLPSNSSFSHSHLSAQRPIQTLSIPPSRAGSKRQKRAAAAHEADGSGTTAVHERDVERGLSGRRRGDGDGDGDEQRLGLDVEVKIEETVTVEYDPEAFEFESYRTPRLLWGEGPSEGTGRLLRGAGSGSGSGTRKGTRKPGDGYGAAGT